MPPSCAIAIANLDSVTVSIAAETIGILIEIFLENLEATLTSLGKISEYDGINKTSSYVNPSPITLTDNVSIMVVKLSKIKFHKSSKIYALRRYIK